MDSKKKKAPPSPSLSFELLSLSPNHLESERMPYLCLRCRLSWADDRWVLCPIGVKNAHLCFHVRIGAELEH